MIEVIGIYIFEKVYIHWEKKSLLPFNFQFQLTILLYCYDDFLINITSQLEATFVPGNSGEVTSSIIFFKF